MKNPDKRMTRLRAQLSQLAGQPEKPVTLPQLPWEDQKDSSNERD